MSNAARVLPATEVFEHFLEPRQGFLKVVEPRESGSIGLKEWVTANKPELRADLTRHGGLLLRNFANKTADFQAAMEGLFGSENLIESYAGGMSRRNKVSEKTFVSTLFPRVGGLPQHFEMSYLRTWPLFISFYCEQPSPYGGNTPISYGRGLLKNLDKKLLGKFDQEGVCYLRAYKNQAYQGVFPTWQEAFESSDPAAAEKFCRANGFEFHWTAERDFKTVNVSQGTVHHPQTREKLFFNHALTSSFYSGNKKILSPSFEGLSSALKPEVVEEVCAMAIDEVPYGAAWGKSRKPIELSVQQDLRAAFYDNMVSFAWKKGDMLILDNLLVAHGRDPFIGERSILTVMAHSHSERA